MKNDSAFELIPFLHGVLSVKETARGLIPLRFTQRQMEVYALDEKFSVRSGAASGIVFACETDADAFLLEYRVFRCSSKDFFSFDLLVDGRLSGHYEKTLEESPEGILTFSLPAGEKRVEVLFPSLAGVEIRSMKLEGASFRRPVRYAGKTLHLGDSITQGYTARFPSMDYVHLLAARLGGEIINQGVGGDTFRPETLDEDFPVQPDRIVIAYGTNDWSKKPREKLFGDAQAYLDKVCRIFPGIPAYMLTPIWRADCGKDVPSGVPFAEWRETLAETASAHPQMCVIPGETLFPEIPELFEDGRLHPEERGFREYGSRLADRILRLEKK